MCIVQSNTVTAQVRDLKESNTHIKAWVIRKRIRSKITSLTKEYLWEPLKLHKPNTVLKTNRNTWGFHLFLSREQALETAVLYSRDRRKRTYIVSEINVPVANIVYAGKTNFRFKNVYSVAPDVSAPTIIVKQIRGRGKIRYVIQAGRITCV